MHTLYSHYLLKMTKNHFFYVFRWWCKDLIIPTRLMDRWECVLWTDGSPIPFSLLPRQNHSVWCPRTQGAGPKAAHSHCWAWMGRIMVWGSFHPGAILLQVEGMMARKSFSPLSYFRDSIASQDTVIISAIWGALDEFQRSNSTRPDHNPCPTVRMSGLGSNPLCFEVPHSVILSR